MVEGVPGDLVQAQHFPQTGCAVVIAEFDKRDLDSHLQTSKYPAALQEAPRLLDQKKNQEANAVLLTALIALVETDQVHSDQDGQALRAHWA